MAGARQRCRDALFASGLYSRRLGPKMGIAMEELTMSGRVLSNRCPRLGVSVFALRVVCPWDSQHKRRLFERSGFSFRHAGEYGQARWVGNVGGIPEAACRVREIPS